MRQTPHGCLVTRTGLVIGGAYTRTPPPPSKDATVIQAAMLTRLPTKPSLLARLLRWLKEMTK